VVISVSAIISIILGGFDYLFVNSIGYLGKLKTPPIKQEILQPTPTIILNVTPTNYAKHINNNK
jgi:hypothetical protein